MNRRARCFCHTLFALVGSMVLVACQARAGEEAGSLAEVTKQLQALPADEKAAADAIPEKGRKLLADLKKQIGLTIQEVVPAGGKKDAGKIRENILKKLKNRHVLVAGESKEAAGGFGRVTALDVVVPPQSEDLLGVKASFSLPCGWTDSDFYLFRYGKRGWTNILLQAAAEYGDISGGQGRFDYALSKKSDEGSLLVVTAFVPPKCKAVNLPIRYNAYRVSPGSLEAQSVFSGVTSVGSADGTYKLQAEEAGMALSYTAAGSSPQSPGGTRETLHLQPRGTRLEITRSGSKTDS